MNRRTIYLLLFTALCSAVAVACQEHLAVKMSEAVPPAFSFQASTFTHYKHLTFFIVIEVAPENQKLAAYEKTPVQNKTIWWIFPDDSQKGDFENLPSITYGKIPAGWNQTVPKNGEPPPTLIEGKVYEAGGPQVEVPWAHMRFTIRNGKAVRLPLYRDEFENHQNRSD